MGDRLWIWLAVAWVSRRRLVAFLWVLPAAGDVEKKMRSSFSIRAPQKVAESDDM